MSLAKKEFKVTPWEVEGIVDYEKLAKEFGLKAINKELKGRLEKLTKKSHYMLEREIFFVHRDLDLILDFIENGKEFFLYTGRGPSGHTHLGHLLPWIFTKWLQDKFNVELYFQLTDDEKYLFNDKLSLEETKKFAYENALDFIALGFKPKNTHIIIDTEYSKTLYNNAIKVAKRITFSTTKAVFGFTNSNNIGEIFFTSIQSVPAFLHCILKNKKIPCLIPHAVDQDPHFRICRDVMPKLGFYKPASIQCKFLPGLGKEGKMSASNKKTAIFTTDSAEVVNKKITNAFTGGRETLAEQKKLGGIPEKCTIFAYFYFFAERDNKKLEEIKMKCKNGSLLCGECKKMLAQKINSFLKRHQAEREKAKKIVDKFLLKD